MYVSVECRVIYAENRDGEEVVYRVRVGLERRVGLHGIAISVPAPAPIPIYLEAYLGIRQDDRFIISVIERVNIHHIPTGSRQQHATHTKRDDSENHHPQTKHSLTTAAIAHHHVHSTPSNSIRRWRHINSLPSTTTPFTMPKTIPIPLQQLPHGRHPRRPLVRK